MTPEQMSAVMAYQAILKRSRVDWRAYVAAVDAKDAKLAEEIDRRRGNTASELDRAKRALDDALSA